MSAKTIKISNVPTEATERDIIKLFSGIEYVELQRDTKWSQIAYVTFKGSRAAQNALLLSNATIKLEPDYKLPTASSKPPRTLEKMLADEEKIFRSIQDLTATSLNIQRKLRDAIQTELKGRKETQVVSNNKCFKWGRCFF